MGVVEMPKLHFKNEDHDLKIISGEEYLPER